MIRRVLGPGGLLAAALPGYESRPGQLAMAERIGQAIENDERLLVEAGTGTGKTLAYLVPAILSGRKVVVSTGTKTLQDQIARVDLPRLQGVLKDVLPSSWRWSVMKGLGNYLCLRRLDLQSRQGFISMGTLSGSPNPPAMGSERQSRSSPARSGNPELERILDWATGTTTGDRADLTDLTDDAAIWRDVSATPETRVGPRCPFFERCFVTGMRRQGAEAQLVVTNHHLFFADLALRSQWPEAQVLPPYEVVIFDEAHQVEEIATEFFGMHVSTQRMFALCRDLGRTTALDAGRALAATARLQSAAGALADALRERLPAPRPGIEEIRVPVPEDLWSGLVLRCYHELDTVLDEIATWLGPDAPAVREAPQAPELVGLGRRAAALRDEIAVFIDSGNREHVRWISAGPRNVSLHASPIDVGPALGRAFDMAPGPVIFTSATLTVAGSFDYVRERTGLRDTASDAAYPSPFHYADQALLYVAADLPEPNAEPFALAAAERGAALCRITHGRALLLFTSFRNLRVAETYLRGLPPVSFPYPLLVQGSQPRHQLLATLRQRLGSVLLATQSFWEGVDVPGEALSLVVIDRLPFAVPDDPLVAARIARVREQDGDPFVGFQVPRAALSLKQGFGRLIRSRSDRGIVALLDGRIVRRSYGGTLLASLPPDCPRTESLEEVALFWTRPSSSPSPASPSPYPLP